MRNLPVSIAYLSRRQIRGKNAALRWRERRPISREKSREEGGKASASLLLAGAIAPAG